ncbi:WD40 repeat-like protein [Lactarius pseudohatsudake]|nr:WD40 repeat-like protein [Lactarius pseudohatsudake]
MQRTNSMLFANFNQDFTCISVGTRKGYSITNCDPFGRVYTMNDGARGIVEMLFCTSLIALVGAADQPSSSPRKLQIVNTKRQSMICELLFPSSILAVKMNRKTLVIVLETEIYIYDISNMRLQHVIETPPNPEAIVALSPSADNSYLAYPSPVPVPAPTPPAPSSAAAAASGDVLLFSTKSLTVSQIIRAHKAPISALALTAPARSSRRPPRRAPSSACGASRAQRSCTSSAAGRAKARIYSLSFNVVSTLLAVSSAHDTVHIFKLGTGRSSSTSSVNSSKDDHATSPSGSVDSRDGAGALEGGYDAFMDDKKKKSGGVSSSLRRRSLNLTKNITSSVGGYLPNTLTEMWEPSRDFAFLKLPTSGARCIVALSGTMPQIMVVSSEGYFYSYSIDLENGGECSLMKQYSLLDSADEASND